MIAVKECNDTHVHDKPVAAVQRVRPALELP